MYDMYREQRPNPATPIFARMHVHKVSSPICSEIVKFIDLHFQGQRFDSSTFGSSYMNISKIVTDRANITLLLQSIKTSHNINFLFAYLDFTLVNSKAQLSCWNGVMLNILTSLF